MATLSPTASRVRLLALSIFILSAVACGGSDNGGNPDGGGNGSDGGDGGSTSSFASVTSTEPANLVTGVATNAKLLATFSEPMNASSLSATTFVVKQGTTAVGGTVALGTGGLTATFTPSAALAASTAYAATITTGATSAAGHALAADYAWSFTTGAGADTVPPTVVSSSPATSATGVATNAKIAITFSEAMDPASLSATTFTVVQGTTPVSGAVSYGALGAVATFTPTANLATGTAFTATITTGAKDLAGNALAAPYAISFTTAAVAAKGPAPVLLGKAGTFVVLAKTAVSTVPSSGITGDIGVSPAAASFITGFSLVADSTNVFATSPQVVGKVYAANYAVPTPSNLTTAVSNMEAAYNDAAGRSTPDFLELGTGNIGGKTLVPGLYKWTSTVTIPADVVLAGSANDVWIFQTSGDLMMSAAKNMTLSGGALAKNIFWQVAGTATFGANSHFEGVVLAKTDIKLLTGTTMNGRTLSQTQVVLQQATLTQPAP